MIVGILVKVNSIVVERRTFLKATPMVRYWKSIRSKYKDANFFIYRATHPIDKINYYTSDSIRYCPYCEEIRDFEPDQHDRHCPVCSISIYNCKVRRCNYPEEE